jgi:Raf kinase inhibitor-like YbhB/YbcL family protein
MKRYHGHARFRRRGAAVVPILLVGLAGCQLQAEPPAPGVSDHPPAASSKGAQVMKIEVISSAFAQGQPIPKKYTGEGEDVSPPIYWKNAPEGTKEFALICDDPDAPTHDPWVHWVIYKIPADVTSLPEGVPQDARLKKPAGALQGKNSWPSGKNVGYRGPFPPPGHGVHHYHFKVYALEAHVVADPGADKKSLLADIQDHILAQGELIGTYQR